MSRDPAPVCRGVAFLDEHVPGWEQQIDLDDLDLRMKDRCVLGQLWLAQHPRTRIRNRAYDEMRKALKVTKDAAEDLGFDLPWDEIHDDGETRCERLTKAWKRVIRRRLKAAA